MVSYVDSINKIIIQPTKMIFNVGTYICVIYRRIRLPKWNLLKLEFERAILSVNKICHEQK